MLNNSFNSQGYGIGPNSPYKANWFYMKLSNKQKLKLKRKLDFKSNVKRLKRHKELLRRYFKANPNYYITKFKAPKFPLEWNLRPNPLFWYRYMPIKITQPKFFMDYTNLIV